MSYSTHQLGSNQNNSAPKQPDSDQSTPNQDQQNKESGNKEQQKSPNTK